MKIFLDVGANKGQTLKYVLAHDFNKIYCFDPVPSCCAFLAKKYPDPRVTIYEFGLWKETCDKLVFSAGSPGGSIFGDKDGIDTNQKEVCKFVRASNWFEKNISINDMVYLKMNCEGAECDIIDDLLDSGEIDKVDFMAIDYDVRKIPSQKHRQKEVRSRLHRRTRPVVADLASTYYANIPSIRDKPPHKVHNYRIEIWLQSCK